MNESAFTRKLLKDLRAHEVLKRDAVIFKHNDFYTAGVPDFSITFAPMERTTWWEVKVAPNVPTKLQQHYLYRLRPAYLLTYHNDTKLVSIQWKDWEPVILEQTYREALNTIVVYAISKEIKP